MPDWLRRRLTVRNVFLGFVALAAVPYLAKQIAVDRQAREAAPDLDAKVSGVKAYLTTRGVAEVVYQDGTHLPVDGAGVVTLTWDDYQKAPDRLKTAGAWAPAEADFPVVAFFNATGFDASGEPVAVRRAKDGSVLVSPTGGKPVAWMSPQRDGSFRVGYKDNTGEVLAEEKWYADYMHLPAEPAKLAESKTGVRGKVLAMAGNPPLAGLEAAIYVFRGQVEPVAKLDGKDQRLVAATASAKDGSFLVALPPGTYTLVVERSGKLYGNGLDQKTWPTVEVKDGFVDYEFRVWR